jgi:hypothetical protein
MVVTSSCSVGPRAAVGIDPTRHIVLEQDVGDPRQKMNSIGKMTLISRGIPTGKQEYLASLLAPPTA